MTPLISIVHPILLFAPGAAGKSTVIAQLIGKLLRGTPYKARIATVEHHNAYDSLVAEGLAEVWKFNSRNFPFETSRQVMDNYWPLDVTDPDSKLVAPTKDSILKYPIRVKEGISTIAGYLAGSYVIGGLTQRIGAGEQLSKATAADDFMQFDDNATGIGGLARGHYMHIQNEMEGLIRRSQKYIGYEIWSAHEDIITTKKATDWGAAGTTVIGPEVIGGAKTTVISREFADVWRVVLVPTENGVERRLYVKVHTDPSTGGVGIARNSRGIDFQHEVPDYLRMTETKDGKVFPMLDLADRIVKKVWGK